MNTSKQTTGADNLYYQTNRQFLLMAESVERCKRDYPDCYHFKLQQAKECMELALGLRAGVELLDKKVIAGKHQMAEKSFFKRKALYLIKHFEQLAGVILENAPAKDNSNTQ